MENSQKELAWEVTLTNVPLGTSGTLINQRTITKIVGIGFGIAILLGFIRGLGLPISISEETFKFGTILVGAIGFGIYIIYSLIKRGAVAKTLTFIYLLNEEGITLSYKNEKEISEYRKINWGQIFSYSCPYDKNLPYINLYSARTLYSVDTLLPEQLAAQNLEACGIVSYWLGNTKLQRTMLYIPKEMTPQVASFVEAHAKNSEGGNINFEKKPIFQGESRKKLIYLIIFAIVVGFIMLLPMIFPR